MSLITEALRKARTEAAAREGRKGGVPLARVGGVRPRAGLALVAATALAAALGGAALAWWASGRTTRTADRAVTPATVEPAAAPGPTQPIPRSTPPAPSGAPPAQGAPGAPAAGFVPTTDRAGAAIVATPPSEPPPSVPAAAGVSRPDPPAAPAAKGPRQADPAAPPRSFVLTAELGYATLHLDYIVYKPSAPFGRVNGQDIVVGSIVDGFVVEEIGESHVRLRDGRGAIVLRVR